VSPPIPSESPAIRIILLDIEGTTTPVDFVFRTLFGYARNNLSVFLHKAVDTREVRACVAGLKAQHTVDEREGKAPPEWRTAAPETEIDSAAR